MIYNFLPLLFLMCFFSVVSINAQEYNQITEVPVFKDGKQLKSAWAGGLNAPQFNEVDLNNNGRKDLFIYDKDAKRYLTFIHVQGDEYIYEPAYARNFPPVNSWIVISDYNCDGIDDIFTHGNLGAPQTYKGYYDSDVLKFEFDHKEIFYQASSGNPLNLYSVSTHKPIFKDVNGDGDKDFLGFDPGQLNKLYYYENLRVEKNIPCDSLYFDRIDRCWGNVKETGGTTLDLILGDTCEFKFLRSQENVAIEENRHAGGTAIDLYDEDKDGVFDLVLGDATYERINYLRNNGTIDYANMYEQDDSFPSYDQPVSIPIFPAPYMIDVDKDGDEDLVVAPFLAGVVNNYQNVWLYDNDGSTSEPFSLIKQDFLVGDMIDVGESSVPSFFDYNNDGKMDIVIGNDGYFEAGGEFLHSLTLYKNTGTSTAPVFEFVDKNYLNVGVLDLQDLAPSFGDIDNDGDGDLLIGENKGRVVLLTNNNGNFENAAFLKDKDNIEIDVGQSSHPILYDFDGNNTLDLIIGSRDGNLVYYENTGTQSSYEFTFRTDSLGKVTSRGNQSFGHSSPAIADFDGDGKKDLILGGFGKGVKFYPNIGTDYNASFTLQDSNYFDAIIPVDNNSSTNGIDPRLKVTAMDISGDGQPEVLIGTNTGGLTFYSQDESIADTNALSTNLEIVSNRIRLYPNPANDFVQIELNNVFESGKDIEVEIFSILGDLLSVQQVYNNQRVKLDVSSLSTGIYVVNMRQDNKLGTLKLIKY